MGRREVDPSRLHEFLRAFAEAVRSPGRVYLTGGATALDLGWRQMTKDIDLSFDPEPKGAFEAIASLKDRLEINVELASAADFVPALPGWRERCRFIVRHRQVDFFHFDLYTQALAKIERGHVRDLADVAEMVREEGVDLGEVGGLLEGVGAAVLRYPAIDGDALSRRVQRYSEDPASLTGAL